MKKVALAKITVAEMEYLQSQERSCNTLKTLLNNQFLTDEDKRIVSIKYHNALKTLNETYTTISEKYNIPYLLNKNFFISSGTNELLVEVFN